VILTEWVERHNAVLGVIAVFAFALAVGGCNTGSLGRSPDSLVVEQPTDADEQPPRETPEDADETPEEPDPPSVVRALSFRGDPAFDVGALSAEQRVRYEDFLRSALDPEHVHGIMEIAGSDCLFQYGRMPFSSHVQAVLMAFRLTGDLTLLDHVDRIAERMREELRDGWRGTVDGTDGTRDGYLNWVHRRHEIPELTGKDTHRVNEQMTHGLVAMIAYALEANRDLESPSGRDYAAHADFWRDYLVNHFEAKWRERRGVESGHPIMTRTGYHTNYVWTRYHYFMWRLTGDDAYLEGANKLADTLWGEARVADTPKGPAYVWMQELVDLGGRSRLYLQPTSYASGIFGTSVTFHLEGFHRWASADTLHSLARTVTEFMMDTDDPIRNGFARDVGGGEPRADLAESPEDRWPRRSIDVLRTGQYAFIGPWDDTGRLTALAERSQGSTDKNTTNLAAALLLDTWLRESPQDTSVATTR